MYVTTCQNNVAEGAGVGVYPDGSRYEGQWSLGLPHGEGKLELHCGEWYKGTFDKGLFEGLGVWTKYGVLHGLSRC